MHKDVQNYIHHSDQNEFMHIALVVKLKVEIHGLEHKLIETILWRHSVDSSGTKPESRLKKPMPQRVTILYQTVHLTAVHWQYWLLDLHSMFE